MICTTALRNAGKATFSSSEKPSIYLHLLHTPRKCMPDTAAPKKGPSGWALSQDGATHHDTTEHVASRGGSQMRLLAVSALLIAQQHCRQAFWAAPRLILPLMQRIAAQALERQREGASAGSQPPRRPHLDGLLRRAQMPQVLVSPFLLQHAATVSPVESCPTTASTPAF